MFGIILKGLLIFVIFNSSSATRERRPGVGGTEQDWGYVQVRERVNMFWWLYYTTACVNLGPRPLILWLQGGPGESASIKGNFMEIGQMSPSEANRTFSWVNSFNVLYIDAPVGSGFSYADSVDDYATTNDRAAEDIYLLLKSFFTNFTEFRATPFYIFGESYGGKLAVHLANKVANGMKNNEISCNLKAVGLGNAYLNPKVVFQSIPRYLLATARINSTVYQLLEPVVNEVGRLVNISDYENAARATNPLFNILRVHYTKYDLYNIQRIYNENETEFLYYATENLVTTSIIPTLQLDSEREFSDYNMKVQVKLIAELLKDCVDLLQQFINENPNVAVVSYNGKMDPMVNTDGTQSWLLNLNLSGKTLENTLSETICIDGKNEGTFSRWQNFGLYFVNEAGHSVPPENPKFMQFLFQQIANWNNEYTSRDITACQL